MAKSKIKLKHKGRTWKIEKSNNVKLKKRTFKGEAVCILWVKPRGMNMSRNLVALNNRLGALKYRRDKSLPSLYKVFFPYQSLEDIYKIAEEYYSSGLVEYAEPEIEGGVKGLGYTTNDSLFSKQWILSNTGQNGSIPEFTPKISEALEFIENNNLDGNSKVKIAVLDEGVESSHDDFREGLIVDGFSVFGNGNNINPISSHHHGTQVAGIICATRDNVIAIAGINPYCYLIPGRIYYRNNGEHPHLMARGIRKAANKGAGVINLSWKSEPSPMIETAIDYAVNKGCIVCAAAGNYLTSDDKKSVVFPGNLDQVITVGAHDHKKNWINLNNTPDDFKFGSCYGREVDISAPGIYIPSLKNQNTSTCCFFGTSAATAIVSGVVGLIKFVNPNLSAEEVRQVLLNSADPVFDSEGTQDFDRFGHGFLNAYEAVKMAYNY